MANPLPCDNHIDQLAVMLMTNLESGDTLTLCGSCVVEWAEMLVGGGPAEPEPQPAQPEATEEVAHLEPETPAPDAGPKSQAEPEATPEAEPERGAQAAQETETPGH